MSVSYFLQGRECRDFIFIGFYICPKCGKRFENGFELKAHLKLHTKEKRSLQSKPSKIFRILCEALLFFSIGIQFFDAFGREVYLSKSGLLSFF